ncbi:MAG: peptidylprolyl isomerase [Pseudomonadota bacterium]
MTTGITIPIRPIVPSRAPELPSACASGGCGCGPAPARAGAEPMEVGAPVSVNGVEIDAEAIALEMQQHPAPDPRAAWQAAAQALVIRELLLQEARRRGVTATAEVDEQGRVEVPEEALIRELLALHAAPPQPEEAECRRYYDSRIERFRTPELFEAAHILIEPAGHDEKAWQAAEAQARALIAQVGDDAQAFAEAARRCSRCPTAAQGGSLGQVRRGELLPVVQEALERLHPGTTAPSPVRSHFGWHVVRLHRRIEGRVLPFEMVKDRIADMLAARAWTVSAVRFVAGLVSGADIRGVRIDPAAIEAELG